MGTMTREQFIEEVGVTPEQVAQEMEDFAASGRYLSDHWDEFAETMPNEFVAIRDTQLVAHSPDLDGLLRELDRQGIDRRAALIDFIDVSDIIMVLPCR